MHVGLDCKIIEGHPKKAISGDGGGGGEIAGFLLVFENL